jgi:hypothetical protein
MTTSNGELFRAFIQYLLRRRSPFSYIVRAGGWIIVAALGLGIVVNIVVPLGRGVLRLGLNTGEGLPLGLILSVVALGATLMVVGTGFELRRYLDDQKRLNRKIVLAIEGRGLRDGPGQALTEAVPERLEGQRRSYLLDLRLSIEDGTVVMPEAILPRIANVNQGVAQALSDIDRRDVSIVYGGMTSVPFTFLTGVLLDDEDNITVLDWDRVAGHWRELDAKDDGKRFAVTGLDAATGEEVVMAISTSYPVLDANLVKAFPGMPVVRMDLDDAGQDAHWSEAKQAALSRQFLDVANRMEGAGVKRIHLVLSAQNSIAFRFGRIYDKRNLPHINVYQFERDADPPYPWSVAMPVSGRKVAEVIATVPVAI